MVGKVQKLGGETVKIIIISQKASVLVLLGLEIDFMNCVRLVGCIGLYRWPVFQL